MTEFMLQILVFDETRILYFLLLKKSATALVAKGVAEDIRVLVPSPGSESRFRVLEPSPGSESWVRVLNPGWVFEKVSLGGGQGATGHPGS